MENQQNKIPVIQRYELIIHMDDVVTSKIVLQRISSRTKQFSLEWENLPDINHKYKKILSKICYEDYIDLTKYIPSELVTLYDYPEHSETKESFLRYITYLVLSKREFLLFIT